jgi:hypothetical protein
MGHEEEINSGERIRAEELARIQRDVIPHSELIDSRDAMGNTPLRTAIEYGALDLVRKLVALGAGVNERFDDGATLLVAAVQDKGPNSLAIMEVLLDAGADANELSTWGTPLQVAAGGGDVGKVTLLLKRGATVDRRNEREVHETALMDAARSGHSDIVQRLLDHGADPALTDDLGSNALEIARRALKGFDPANIALLERGGLAREHIDLVRKVQDEIALRGRHAEVIRILEAYRTTDTSA